MAIYNTVTINVDDWVDVNTLSGAPVGNAIRIQNISSYDFYIYESSTKPVSTDGPVVYNPSHGALSVADITAGSLRIWAKPVSIYPIKLAVSA